MPYYDPDLQGNTAPSKVWSVLENVQPAKLWPKQKMIYLQGEAAAAFYYLKKGRVKIFLSSENGNEKTLTILSSGSIFGEAAFFDGLPRVSSARAVTASEIVAIDRPSLMSCFRREPELAMALLQYLSKTVRMLSGQVDGMAFLQADQRIAQILLRLSSQSNPCTAHCTHEELGSLAGVSRVTVSRTLTAFGKKGWIKTGYRSVLIRDPEALSLFSQAV